jgi:hypothetical protein
VAVLVMAVGGVTAVSAQVRCLDAAREAARLAARGDDISAGSAARAVAPPNATLEVHRDGGFVVARVSSRSGLLPGVVIAATAVAAAEPGA